MTETGVICCVCEISVPAIAHLTSSIIYTTMLWYSLIQWVSRFEVQRTVETLFSEQGLAGIVSTIVG